MILYDAGIGFADDVDVITGGRIGTRIGISRVIRFFKNVRLTAVVILLLIVIYFLGLVLPQKWMFDTKAQYDLWLESNFFNRLLDILGFTDIYVSPLTVILLVLFFINLLMVTFNRVPIMLKRAMLMGEPPEFSVDDIRKNEDATVITCDGQRGEVSDQTRKYFRKQRWYIGGPRLNDVFYAVKNRLSPIGFLLFHLSFLLCLIGALLITYTRFSGKLALTEGQLFENDIQQFHKITSNAKILKMLPSLGLLVEKVQPVYENDIPTELAVVLQVKYWDDVEREVLKVNEPIKRGPLSIIADNIGISPLFVIRGPSGKEIDGAYVSLNVLNGKEDYFRFDLDNRYTFSVKFFPDYIIENGIESTGSIEIKNPAIHLTAEKEGKRIFDGTIRLRERAAIDPFSISFDDIRFWVEFIIVREYGKMVLISGFLFASVGLIMRLVFYQKRLRIAFESREDKTVVYIDGRSEYFGHSFKVELKGLVSRLENFLKEYHDKDI